jgi:hypothetical protein
MIYLVGAKQTKITERVCSPSTSLCGEQIYNTISTISGVSRKELKVLSSTLTNSAKEYTGIIPAFLLLSENDILLRKCWKLEKRHTKTQHKLIYNADRTHLRWAQLCRLCGLTWPPWFCVSVQSVRSTKTLSNNCRIRRSLLELRYFWPFFWFPLSAGSTPSSVVIFQGLPLCTSKSKRQQQRRRTMRKPPCQNRWS